jgi:hypothetical protein
VNPVSNRCKKAIAKPTGLTGRRTTIKIEDKHVALAIADDHFIMKAIMSVIRGRER